MADVRKLLQAERRLREAVKPKPNPVAPAASSRASTKRSLSETDEAATIKRQRTSEAPSVTGLPANFFDEGVEEGGEGVGATTDETLETSNGGDNPYPQNENRGNAGVEKDDASMEGAPEANDNSSTLPSDFFEAKSSIPSTARVEVDEDEWAAFQADVVEPVRPITTSVMVIEAAPTTNNHTAAPSEQDAIDDYAKGEEEDAKQKLLDEFEEMEGLEQRVLRLKERREALKNKVPRVTKMEVVEVELDDQNAEEDEDDEDDDDFFQVRRP